MISIRKQLFAILFSTGMIIILGTSLVVNVIIAKQFDRYVQENIKQAGDVIVQALEDVYQSPSWQKKLEQTMVLKTYMGNFSIRVLDRNKHLISDLTLDKIDTEKKLKHYYRFEQRALKDRGGEVIGYVEIGYSPSLILSSNDRKFQSNVKRGMIWCGIMVLGCFAIIGIYITRLFTKHIYGIARTSIALAEGKLDTRYHNRSKIKEIETLRYSMNYLAEKLEHQDMIRKKLISDVSHEIRTPLHILQSNLEAMIDGIYPVDNEQMESLYKEVVRFGKLLNNLDKLKNAEDKTTSLNLETLKCNESLEDVFNAFKIVAKEKKIKYHLNNAKTQHVMLYSDKDALKQIWMNILSNAFKFTPNEGTIMIETWIDNKDCVVSIQDTGIGILEEDMPYIFERMYRGDKSREQYEGSGLGLTIVKTLVELQGGRVKIESKKEQGTKVNISLPIQSVQQTQSITGKVKSYMKLGMKNENK